MDIHVPPKVVWCIVRHLPANKCSVAQQRWTVDLVLMGQTVHEDVFAMVFSTCDIRMLSSSSIPAPAVQGAGCAAKTRPQLS